MLNAEEFRVKLVEQPKVYPSTVRGDDYGTGEAAASLRYKWREGEK